MLRFTSLCLLELPQILKATFWKVSSGRGFDSNMFIYLQNKRIDAKRQIVNQERKLFLCCLLVLTFVFMKGHLNFTVFCPSPVGLHSDWSVRRIKGLIPGGS